MASDPISYLLADEHFPDPVTFRLRRLGHDVIRVRDFSENKSGDGDEDRDVLKRAIEGRRTLVTANWTDFVPLHNANPSHSGIIGTKHFADWDDWAKEIDAAIRYYVLRKKQPLDGMFIHVPFDEPDDSRPVPLKKSSR